MNKFLGLPPLASEAGGGVDTLIIYIHWLMIALFIGWLGYFFLSIYKFRSGRNPKADYVGVRSHASSYIEVAVAGVEVVLLVLVALPLWIRHAADFPKPEESTVIQIVAQQFNWNARYPGLDGKFGHQDMKLVASDNTFGVDPADPAGKDDVQVLNEIHVPVNKSVLIYLSSKDVIHSLKLVAMRITQDAIPGLRIPCTFTPNKIGRYQIECAQLCGGGHAAMAGGFLVVQSKDDYKAWLESKSGPAAPAKL